LNQLRPIGQHAHEGSPSNSAEAAISAAWSINPASSRNTEATGY